MVRRTNQANQQKQNNPTSTPVQLTFLEHFYELRKRLFFVALTLVVTTGIGLEIKDRLIAAVVAPLKGTKLVYLTPGGGFSFIFTLSLYFGILLTIPVITYHLYSFLRPMIKNASRRFVWTFISASVLLAVLGAALAYYLAIPSALGFLNDVAGGSIVPNLTADSYLKFVITYVVGLAALFQIPLLIFLFDHIRPFPPGTLQKSQRYGIVASTILAGLITPSPDLMNYAIVLFPILGAYEFGVFAVFMRRRLTRAKTAKVLTTAEQADATEVSQSVAATSSEEPLTAIIEGLTDDTDTLGEQPELVSELVAGSVPEEPDFIESRPVAPSSIPARRRSSINQIASAQSKASIGQPVQIVPAARDSAGVEHATTAPQVQKPRRVSTGKNIDGFYKTDPRTLKIQASSTGVNPTIKQRQNPQKKSIDGFLTASA